MIGRVFLGRYEVVRLLGEGGMARVFLAKQLDLDRQVVVKVMHDHIAADPKFRDRFKRETNIMAHFHHAFAVTLFDASLDDPQGPCIVMEYVRGVPLEELLQPNKGRINPARANRMLSQLCEVLQAAHAQGIIHRDLKPANLMVMEAETPYEKIKVMDFGLAKIVDPPNLNQISVTGMDFAVGTPAYICPEQVRGEVMDHRGDLYSVGIILYELLAGRTPRRNRPPSRKSEWIGSRPRLKKSCGDAWPRSLRNGRRAPATWPSSIRPPWRKRSSRFPMPNPRKPRRIRSPKL